MGAIVLHSPAAAYREERGCYRPLGLTRERAESYGVRALPRPLDSKRHCGGLNLRWLRAGAHPVLFAGLWTRSVA